MTTILAFIIVLGVLVFVHELGHFLTAKATGIRVLEFGFGFPPRLIGIRRGETIYSLNLFPLGGFVKLAGEEDPSEPGSFASKSLPVRTAVLTAGPLMNAMLPVLIFALLFAIPRDVAVGKVVVQEVNAGSPAEEMGLVPGDIILKASGRPVENSQDLFYYVRLRLGAELALEVERPQGTREVLRGVPRWDWPAGEGPLGILVKNQDLQVERRSEPFWEALPLGARRSVETLVLAKNEVMTWFIGSGHVELAGPVGIAQLTGEVARSGVLALLELTALLSLNLAILNILPIPALDGGRLLFLGIEAARRGKRISPKREALVHLIGFAVLMAIIIVISYNDILRIIRGGNLLG